MELHFLAMKAILYYVTKAHGNLNYLKKTITTTLVGVVVHRMM